MGSYCIRLSATNRHRLRTTPKQLRDCSRVMEVEYLGEWLPAVSAAATATATTPLLTTAAATTAALAGSHRTRFIDNYRAAHEVAAIAGFDGAVPRRGIIN